MVQLCFKRSASQLEVLLLLFPLTPPPLLPDSSSTLSYLINIYIQKYNLDYSSHKANILTDALMLEDLNYELKSYGLHLCYAFPSFMKLEALVPVQFTSFEEMNIQSLIHNPPFVFF